jgi:hypothetical protein
MPAIVGPAARFSRQKSLLNSAENSRIPLPLLPVSLALPANPGIIAGCSSVIPAGRIIICSGELRAILPAPRNSAKELGDDLFP